MESRQCLASWMKEWHIDMFEEERIIHFQVLFQQLNSINFRFDEKEKRSVCFFPRRNFSMVNQENS